MKLLWALILSIGLLGTSPVLAQQSNADCEVQSLSLDGTSESSPSSPATARQPAVTDATPAVSVSPSTNAEARVQEVIEEDGIHVIHFWAPWCSNSKRELKSGWTELVAAHPNVTFTFVTVWNNGDDGAALLDEYGLPDRVTAIPQPDLGPSGDESNRRKSFLSHPVTWIPSTWIFHNNGELAFALNYGEMDVGTIESLLKTARKNW